MAALWRLNFLLADSGLTLDDRVEVEGQLSALTVIVVVMVLGLVVLTLAIRQIARRTTQPCPACMEFISKHAAVCPKCGVKLQPSR